ncbi:MAG: NUDIX hydrolase [bacterium]
MEHPKPIKHHPIPAHAKKVFQGTRWNVFQWEQEMFDGTKQTYETIHRMNSVIIFPVIDKEILILEEEQPHWGKKAFTLVAGGLEKGENIFEGAKRELEEETGLVFKDLYLIGISQEAPNVGHYSYTFVAKNVIGEKLQELDPGERITVKKVSFSELISLAKQRKFFYKPSFIDEMIIQDRLPEFAEILENPEKFEIKISD